MPDILHRVAIKASLDDVYRTLATRDGLAKWWTTDTRGDGNLGDTIHFQFGDLGFFDMKVLESDEAKHVLWQVVGGPEEWIGTTVRWNLEQDGEWVAVMFKHENWREPVDFMHHCSTKWAIFLMSLKTLHESGRGAPYPNDVKIDNWN